MNNTQINSKKKLRSLIVPKEIEVLISSTGGVGTTFLIEHINKYKLTNHIGDNDKLKHIVFPPVSYNKNIKYIFIFGNPIDSVISLFKRNLYHNHSSKLVQFNNKFNAISQNTTLEEYARGGIDRFLFAEQFINWLTLSKFYPTLFLKYEKIWDNLDILYEFLEIPMEELSKFPEKKKRKSDFSILNKETQKGLKNIYGEYERYIEYFDDCLIVNNRKNTLIPQILFTKTFYYTARRSVARNLEVISPTFLNFLTKTYFSGRK